MLKKGDSNTPKLPVQLLARILQLLDLQTRLQTCALVCSSWQQAAVLSVRDIAVKACTSAHAAALSAWLSAHGSDAQVSSIAVTPAEVDWQEEVCHLVLPVQQLSQLRDLRLTRDARSSHNELQVRLVDGQGRAAPLFGSPGCVTGLTHLEVCDCCVSLQSLRSCTALQHLDYRPPCQGPDNPAGLSADVSFLLEALPQLSSCLTFLQLRGTGCPDCLMLQLSSLRGLKELCLDYANCSTASFSSSLPSGLTRLSVSLSAQRPNAQRVFSPSTTAGAFSQLTALQDLKFYMTDAVDVALLAGLTQLTQLFLRLTPLFSTAGGPTLRALSALTQLRHLSLYSLGELPAFDPQQVAPAAEDYAALTASTQLTYLQLPAGINWQRGAELFPQGAQLPHLEQLELPQDLFNYATVTNLVRACGALKRLFFTVEPDLAIDDEVPDGVEARTVEQLTALSGSLTHLRLQDSTIYFEHDAWGALARLTGLCALSVDTLTLQSVEGFEQLTALRQLTSVSLAWATENEPGTFNVTNKSPAGSPSDVWNQLPLIAPQLLGPCVQAMDSEMIEDAAQCRILEAFWGALDHTMRRQRQEQQQQQDQQQQQEFELTQLRQRVQALEAQVTGLQAELAAVRL